MKKKCSKCLRTRRLKFFNKDKRYRKDVSGWCNKCHLINSQKPEHRKRRALRWAEKMKDPVFRESERIRSSKKYHKNPRKQKDRILRTRRGGISLKQHEKTKRCLICKRKRAVLDADHNHRTNKYRGALCRRCNLMIAMVEAIPNAITKIKSYLKRGL